MIYPISFQHFSLRRDNKLFAMVKILAKRAKMILIQKPCKSWFRTNKRKGMKILVSTGLLYKTTKAKKILIQIGLSYAMAKILAKKNKDGINANQVVISHDQDFGGEKHI